MNLIYLVVHLALWLFSSCFCLLVVQKTNSLSWLQYYCYLPDETVKGEVRYQSRLIFFLLLFSGFSLTHLFATLIVPPLTNLLLWIKQGLIEHTQARQPLKVTTLHCQEYLCCFQQIPEIFLVHCSTQKFSYVLCLMSYVLCLKSSCSRFVWVKLSDFFLFKNRVMSCLNWQKSWQVPWDRCR